jgi:two-component system cell cycle sensor histidine kinase/response regulator CckA
MSAHTIVVRPDAPAHAESGHVLVSGAVSRFWIRLQAGRASLFQSVSDSLACLSAARPWRLPVRLAWLRRPPASAVAARFGLQEVLFEQGGAGLLVVDRAARIVAANTAIRELAGVAPATSPGMAAPDLFASDRRQHLEDELHAALAGRSRPGFVSQLAGMAGDSAVSVTVLPLHPARRLPLRLAPRPAAGALLRVVDITPQRKLQAQLAQAQKLQAVGSLAGGIAHDFNNLLTAVLGAAEAIAARPGLDHETVEDVAQITAGARRGEALVRQLLAFGRQQTLQPQVLDVNERVADLSGMLRRLLGSGIRLNLALEEPSRRVLADPTQLDQVLVNLAVNARDAMPQGGTLTLRSGHVTLYRPLLGGAEVIPPGRYVMIEVEDTGAGIPPKVLPRIFDPFFTTKRERGGNGLGLSTVHGIVRQSDGFLAVESEPGQGTRMRVYLPRYDGEATVTPVPSETRAPEPALAVRGTVLLVDDEEPVLRLAQRALARQGWRVIAASGGDEALARLEILGPDEMPQAVVSDMVMPDMDGAALVRAVRKRLDAPHLPALLVSGYAEASLRTALIESDRVGFLPKPYALKQLADRLAQQVAAGAQTAGVQAVGRAA